MSQHISNITTKQFKNFYENRNLGSLIISNPKTSPRHGWTIKINLQTLYEELLCPKGHEDDHKITIDNIRAIILYGSSLFKHFPPIIKSRKKWRFFGPNIIKIKEKGPPHDIDFMILLRNKLKDMNNDIIIPKVHKTHHGYGSYDVRVDSSIELSYGSNPKGLKLHIAYRTDKQFLNGIDKGDTISTWIYKYGVPFVGKQTFLEMIKNISEIKKEPLHTLSWNYEEKLNGSLIDYKIEKVFSPKNKFELIDI